ncbi:MAG: hypothetical protein Q4Q17_05970 [Tissierellia bacterium]|nr:hypothetical protein [Tissierellia bacterium]
MNKLNRVSAFFLKLLGIIIILLVVLTLAFIVKWRIDHLYLSSIEGRDINFTIIEEFKKTRQELLVYLGKEEPPRKKLVTEEEQPKNIVSFVIPQGSDRDMIGKILLEKGLISDEITYRELVDEMGLVNKFQYGNYEIPKGAKVKEVLAKITGTKLKTCEFSIAGGANGDEVGSLLERIGVIESAQAFGQEAKNMNRYNSFVGGYYKIEVPRKLSLIIEELTTTPNPPQEQAESENPQP